MRGGCVQRGRGCPRRRRHIGGGRSADGVALAAVDEALATLLARNHVLHLGQETVAPRGGQQQPGRSSPREVMHQLGSRLQFDQGRERLAVTTCPWQAGHGHGVDAAVAAESQQRVHRAALEGAIQAITSFEGKTGGFVSVALAGTHPALLRHHHGDRFIDDFYLGHGLLLGLDQGATRITKGLGVGLDLLDHQAPQGGRAAEDLFELLLLVAQLLEFLLDLDCFQPRQLTQPDLEDVVGLALGELEARNQCGLGLVRIANDADHFVHIEQNELSPLQDMDAVEHLVQAVPRAALDRGLAESNPLLQRLAQGLLGGAAIQPDHGHVHGRRRLEAGVGQQGGDELLLLDAAGLGFADQAHGSVLAGLVAHTVEHGQDRGLDLVLFLRQGLLAGLDLGIGEFLDLFQHLLRAHARRQLGHDQLPLAPREILDLPARTHLERATAGAVGLGNVGRGADDLATARIVRARQDIEEFPIAQPRVLDQRHAGLCHLGQVVARNFSRQAHGNTRGTVEQGEGQARRQLFRFFGGAVVVGHEVHRALVDLVEQQAGDLRQACLGVAHGGRAIAVAAAEVALAVDQRVALREVLGHAHQRVVGGLVTVRMEAAQHVTDHPGALHGLGRRVAAGATVTQPHARHGVQDAALHRLLPIGHVGQGPALDDTECVFEVGALCVIGQCQGVVARGIGRQIERGLIHRVFSNWVLVGGQCAARLRRPARRIRRARAQARDGAPCGSPPA